MTGLKRIRFADLGDVVAGQHIPADQYNGEPSGTPYLTGPADFTDRLPHVTKWTNHPRSFSKKSDVLLTVKGAGCGKSNLGIDAAIGRQLMALRPDPEKLDRNYLYNFIKSQEERICQLGQGATVPGIAKGDIESIEIPYLPLTDQRRIAAILDKADAIRRKREEGIRLTEELLRSTFLEMFNEGIVQSEADKPLPGWRSTTIDGIKDKTDRYACVGGPFGSDLTSDDYVAKPGVPVLRGQNLSNEHPFVSEDDFVFVSDAKANSLHKCSAKRGDVIVSQRGARLAGQVGLIPQNSRFPHYIVSQSQMKITVDESQIDPAFLICYLQSKWAVREMENRTIATGVPHINLGILKGFPVHVPPRSTQLRFRNTWNMALSLISKRSELHRDSESLFASLVQRAFRGEL